MPPETGAPPAREQTVESVPTSLPSRIARNAVVAIIRLYQSTASTRPAVCRYSPTCSEYAVLCVRRHGVVAGAALAIRRVLRCNPLSSGGYDPAP